MKKRFQSGASKRQRQKENENTLLNQRNSLAAYLVTSLPKKKECSTSEVGVESDTTDAVKDLGTLPVTAVEVEPYIEDTTNNLGTLPIIGSEDPIENECINSVLDFPIDIALWPLNLTSKMIEYYLINKPCNIGNIKNLKFEYTHGDKIYHRNLSDSHFFCLKANGLKEYREWLIFSETTKCVYCYVCKLFSKTTLQTKLISGFKNWGNLTRALRVHERSSEHISSMFVLKKRSSINGRIDEKLAKQICDQENYWRQVLKRIIATVKLLASMGIGFRGHDDSIDSKRKGNFLSCIEYLSEFDNFLKVHLEKFGNSGSGSVNYLSNTICDEFISLMANEVQKQLICEVKDALYFSLIVDSTPDISHIDQLTLILRFVQKNGDIKERFYGFIPIESHSAEYMEKIILERLRELSIDIKKCRGQSYDNAANMSGKYNGLQSRIKVHSKTAIYIPCANHSLNLVGNCAAESCSGAVSYFNFVQNIYVYFSSSTRRWNILKNCLKDTKSKNIKRLCDTRWSARSDAVSALKLNYKYIKDALSELSRSEYEKPIGKIEAKKLSQNFDNYEIALLTVLWDKLLQRINSTNQSLQGIKCNILNGITLLTSLSEFVMDVRNKFEDIENDANLLTNNRHYKESRYKKRKLQADETIVNETIFTGKHFFIVNVHNVICDVLIVELSSRSAIYNDVLGDFKLFIDHRLSESEIYMCIKNLQKKYEEDIDIDYFKDEIIHFIKFINRENIVDPHEMYKILIDGLKSTFPNVETILKIFLTMPISNASGERSFSVLKRVKSYLRNCLSQPNLCNLSIMFIENEFVQLLDYDKIIDNFSKIKSRRVVL